MSCDILGITLDFSSSLLVNLTKLFTLFFTLVKYVL